MKQAITLLCAVTGALLLLVAFMRFSHEWSWRQNTAALEMAQPGGQ